LVLFFKLYLTFFFSKNQNSAAVDKLVKNFILSSDADKGKAKPQLKDPKTLHDTIVPEEANIKNPKGGGKNFLKF